MTERTDCSYSGPVKTAGRPYGSGGDVIRIPLFSTPVLRTAGPNASGTQYLRGGLIQETWWRTALLGSVASACVAVFSVAWSSNTSSPSQGMLEHNGLKGVRFGLG